MNSIVNKREVSVGLGLGIFFMPYLFSWFTLRDGYSKLARYASFSWLVILFLVFVSGGDKKPLQLAKSSTSQVATQLANVPEPAPSVEIVVEKQQIIDISAFALFEQYDANEVAADLKYKGKSLRVTGVVDSIDKDLFDNIVVKLKSSNERYSFNDVFVYVNEQDLPLVAKMAKKQSLMVVCVGAGLMMKSPILRECAVQ